MPTSREIPTRTRIPVIIYDKLQLHNEFMRKMRQMDHRYYLKLKEIESITMLTQSLVTEGRFYGADYLD